MRFEKLVWSGVAALALAAHAPAMAQDNPLLADLPPELSSIYEGTTDELHPSAYDNFAFPAAPWKWCHSESYQGNPWRVALTNELERLVDGLKADGTVSDFEMSDSNGDASQQIAQIRAFIDKKCSIITVVAGSTTALNDAIKAAYDAGIPVVTTAGAVTSEYAINVDSNFTRWGYDMAKAIGESIGSGNVLLVEGIAGSPIVAQERVGGDKGFAEYPDLSIAGSVNGNWTANVTKTVVLNAIATNPASIDAVWTTGSESRVVAEAFAEAGRPAPLITGSISGDALGYWKENPDAYRFEGHALLPGWAAQTLYRVAVRLLEGQQPKLNTLMISIPPVHYADLDKWYKPCMTPDTGSIFPVPPEDPISEDLLNAYFVKPAPTRGWDYSQVPDACAGQ